MSEATAGDTNQTALSITPTLLKLKAMKGADGKPMKIVQKIAANDYTTFGMYLLQDDNGEAVAIIEKDHLSRGAESVTQAILQKWLTSGAPTRTYEHLVECLKLSELGALAESIISTIEGDSISKVTEHDQDSVPVPLPKASHLTEAQQEPVVQSVTNMYSDHFVSYTSYIKELYTCKSHSHTSQHWTHLPRCEFIQLAMIGSDELRRGDREEELIRLAQLGRVETILSHKEPIDLENLFSVQQPLVVLPPPPHARVILIEGAPGGGKSTLVLHICHKWAQGVSFLDRFDLVILAYLRDQAVQNATNLADILPDTLEDSQTIVKHLQVTRGQNVLFVFDGWDEFPSHLQKNSLVSTIIKCPQSLFLHQSTVLITSRPVSSGNLLHIADQRVEILGFTQHQIRVYIEKALDGNTARMQKLFQHLEDHPVIEGYCYVPLHVAILVHVFLTMKGALPTTHHELFHSLALCCIVRELETHESVKDLSDVLSLDDLPDDLRFNLSNLCVLAYEGVMQDKAVFYQEDLKTYHLPTNLPSFGLLQVTEGLTLLSKSLSYNFLHLSVQELLTAYHISHMDSSEQILVFKSMFKGSRFQAVLYYYSGFTKLSNPEIRDFIATYSQQQKSITDLLTLLHCFYEAQELSLCKLIVNSQLAQKIVIPSKIAPVDYLAIGYFIRSLLSVASPDAASNVVLVIIQIDDHRFKLLLHELSKYRIGRLPLPVGAASLRRLEIELSGIVITAEGAKLIATLLEKSVELTIASYEIDSGSFVHQIAGALQKSTNPCLTKLRILHQKSKLKDLCRCYDDGLALKRMCEINTSLMYLDLSGTKLGEFAWGIFEGLQHNTTLVQLNLSNTGIVASVHVIQTLTKMLQVNKTLTHLDLSSNEFSSNMSRFFGYLFQSLQDNTALVHLNISNMQLEPDTVAIGPLSKMLQFNQTLKYLDISNNWAFSDAGAISVSQGLRHNIALVYLNLNTTGMTDKGAASIVKTLTDSNRSLETLDVSHNKLRDTRSFIKLRKDNTTLKSVNFTQSLFLTPETKEIVAAASEIYFNKHQIT